MPALPPFSKPIILVAILFDILVFGLGARAFILQLLMIVANLGVCLIAYWTILGHFIRPPAPDADQSPSRNSSPISE